MNLEEKENYSQDGQSFQNDTQYRDNDSVSNVLDNSVDDEQGIYNEEDDPEQDYKDSDDIDPDDFEEEELTEEEDLEDEDLNDDENLNETNLENDINETDSANSPREF